MASTRSPTLSRFISAEMKKQPEVNAAMKDYADRRPEEGGDPHQGAR